MLLEKATIFNFIIKISRACFNYFCGHSSNYYIRLNAACNNRPGRHNGPFANSDPWHYNSPRSDKNIILDVHYLIARSKAGRIRIVISRKDHYLLRNGNVFSYIDPRFIIQPTFSIYNRIIFHSKINRAIKSAIHKYERLLAYGVLHYFAIEKHTNGAARQPGNPPVTYKCSKFRYYAPHLIVRFIAKLYHLPKFILHS